jgi:hypothetical protein
MGCSFVYFEICFHGDFADGCARVWRGRVERFRSENVILRDRYVDGIVLIWNKIGHYSMATQALSK